MSPHLDLTKRFIKAMYASPRETRAGASSGSLSTKANTGASTAPDAWETEDVRRRLAHLDFEIPLHNWREESRRAAMERKGSLTSSVGSKPERIHKPKLSSGPATIGERTMSDLNAETAESPPTQEDDGGGVGPMEGDV